MVIPRWPLYSLGSSACVKDEVKRVAVANAHGLLAAMFRRGSIRDDGVCCSVSWEIRCGKNPVL